MTDVKIMARPHRWDTPFGPEMGDEDVRILLKRPEIAAIHADKFPATVPLAGVLKNDTRIVRFQPGDIIVREGDYGNSAFLILEGNVRVVLAPGLPDNILGRQITQKKSFLQSLSQKFSTAFSFLLQCYRMNLNHQSQYTNTLNQRLFLQ